MRNRVTALTVLTTGFVVGFQMPALADSTSGDGGILSGNQIGVPITLPVEVSGNAVGIFGEAAAASRGGTRISRGGGRDEGDRTSGDGGVLSGNQVEVPVTAPVTVCGNAVAILGTAGAGCAPKVKIKSRRGGNKTSGDGGILSGNQVEVPVTAPVTVCGNAIAILGTAGAGCAPDVEIGGSSHHGRPKKTSGDGGILSGNQVEVPVTAPVTVCGNAIGVLSEVAAGCAPQTGSSHHPKPHAEPHKPKDKHENKDKPKQKPKTKRPAGTRGDHGAPHHPGHVPGKVSGTAHTHGRPCSVTVNGSTGQPAHPRPRLDPKQHKPEQHGAGQHQAGQHQAGKHKPRHNGGGTRPVSTVAQLPVRMGPAVNRADSMPTTGSPILRLASVTAVTALVAGAALLFLTRRRRS